MGQHIMTSVTCPEGATPQLYPMGAPWGPMGPHGAPWGPMGPCSSYCPRIFQEKSDFRRILRENPDFGSFLVIKKVEIWGSGPL